MSFAARTKKELTQISAKPCCDQAELTALLQQCATLRIADGESALDIATENAAIARRIYTLLKNEHPYPLEVLVQRKMRLKKNNIYIVRLRHEPLLLLEKHGLAPIDGLVGQSVPEQALKSSCCKKAYLRGAFLASGSVNDPDSHSYHLELTTKSLSHAEGLLRLLREYRLHAKMIERKKGYIVYIKEGEKIVEFLGIVGAHQALLHFEEVRIVKGMRNQVNRIVNCETANLNKTILAAVRQIDNIRFLEQEVGLDRLPPKLRMVAELRLAHPDITLQELALMLPERVSKSGLNHRLRKLDELAVKLRAGQGRGSS